MGPKGDKGMQSQGKKNTDY